MVSSAYFLNSSTCHQLIDNNNDIIIIIQTTKQSWIMFIPYASCIHWLGKLFWEELHKPISLDFNTNRSFPTCQVRVVRFYVSCLPLPLLPLLPSAPAFRLACLLLVLLVLLVQLRSAIHIVRCRTSTTTIHAQRSLPDLNHDHPRPVFPAGPQPRVSPPSVPCRTSTTTIHAQCSLSDLNHDHPRPLFPAGPQPRVSTPSVPCRTSCRRYAR